MSQALTYGVFILRGQPVHNAHVHIIKQILAENDYAIILIGSAHMPSTFKNPFSWQDRAKMIHLVPEFADCGRIICRPISDYMYDDVKWATQVQNEAELSVPNAVYTLYGHVKEDTKEYLELFGNWNTRFVDAVEPLNATMIRHLYFSDQFNPNMIAGVVPKNVLDELVARHNSDWWRTICDENKFVVKLRSQYSHLPYPIIFSTADAVVTQGANILLIRRKAIPGKGLWALPGGYVNAIEDRSVFDAAIRELREETKIKVPAPVLRRCVKNQKVFDHPNRSPRGRIITHAFHFDLRADQPFPKVSGADDAEKAKWFPLSAVRRGMMFEDHWDIISYFTGI